MRVVRIFFGLENMWSGVAEVGGRVVGTIFSYEGDPIHGVALVSVDTGEQRRGVGRRLMEAALARATNAAGVRLIQETFNVHALGLYASLGSHRRSPRSVAAGCRSSTAISRRRR